VDSTAPAASRSLLPLRLIALPTSDGGLIALASTFAAIRPAPMNLFVVIFDFGLAGHQFSLISVALLHEKHSN
jgi:hypothetical protein